MTSRNSTSSVLIALLLIITFPIWLGLIAGAFGLIAGLFGAAAGIIGGIFGAITGVIGGFFGAIFHPFGWHHGFHFFGVNAFTTICLLFVIILIATRSRKGGTDK